MLFYSFNVENPTKNFLILFTLVKWPQTIGECRNPLREVEQNSRPDRDSGANPVLKQTNKQLQAKTTVKAGENNPKKTSC